MADQTYNQAYSQVKNILLHSMLKIEAISFAVPIPVVVYYVFTSYTFLHDNLLKFLVLISIIAGSASLGGILANWRLTRTMVSAADAIIAGRTDADLIVMAKKNAYRLPLLNAFIIMFKWTVMVNLIGVLPYVIAGEMTVFNYLSINLLLLMIALNSVPYHYLVSELHAARFLRIPQVAQTPIDENAVVKLGLTKKLLLILLLTAIPPIIIFINVIVLSMAATIDLQVIFTGLILLTVESIAMSFINGFLFMRNMQATVGTMSSLLDDIGQGKGDLSKRIFSASRDELGNLAGLFNRFIGNLSNIILGVKSSVKTLGDSSRDMDTAAADLSEGVTTMARNATQSANITDTLRDDMADLQETAAQYRRDTEKMADAIETMNASLAEVAQKTERTREHAGKAAGLSSTTSEDVARLEESAKEIRDIVSIITEISGQTRLLALNATIEAARAGEAGKGFQIIAGEVKTLAAGTNNAIASITTIVNNIEQATQAAMSRIQSIDGIVSDIDGYMGDLSGSIEEQYLTTASVANRLAVTRDRLNEISEKINRAADNAGRIADDMKDNKKQSDVIDRRSREIKEDAEGLSRLAAELESLFAQFIVRKDND